MRIKKTSKFALESNKWIIVSHYLHIYGIHLAAYRFDQEYQENESSLVVEEVELNQTVNLYGCKNTTVVIKGKLNAVTLGKYHV